MGDKFLNAQVSEDSELWASFEHFQENEGYESKSEAVRAAVRRGVRDKTPETEPAGFVDAATSALADDAYALVRDGVISTAILLMLSTVITAFSPWWASAAVNMAVVGGIAISLTAAFGGVIGTTIRIWDRFGPEVTVERDGDETGADA